MGLDRKRKEGDRSPLSSLVHSCLALGELEALPGALLSVLLALLGARVTGQESGLLELLAQLTVELAEGPGDAMANGTRLASAPAARDIDQYVELGQRIGQLEWLSDNHPQRLVLKVIVDWGTVDLELTAPFAKVDTCGSAFATTGSVIL